ncbi:MAG: maleate cis-trans isomerase, partial [Thermomicrobiales bacterium]|nr:maleate cis-trans isomerase [Thermomicrobiales bacterium]
MEGTDLSASSTSRNGWYEPTKHVGLILPHLDSLTEPFLARTLPPQIGFHASRMRRIGALDAASLASMNEELEATADRLPTPFLDLIVYHCTSGSVLGGRELERTISARTSRPVFTTSTAVQGALRAVGAADVCLITPYYAELARAERHEIESSGFSVVAEGGRQILDGIEIQNVTPSEIAAWAMAAVD